MLYKCIHYLYVYDETFSNLPDLLLEFVLLQVQNSTLCIKFLVSLIIVSPMNI